MKHLLTFLLFGSLAFAQVSVQGNLIHTHNATAGATLTGNLLLKNNGKTPETLKIFLQDYQFELNSTRFAAPGTLSRSNALWVKLPQDTITVPAGGEINLPYQIQVPEDPRKGTFWSVLMLEPADVPVTTSSQGLQLRQVMRTAVQIITEFGGARAELKFGAPNLKKAPQKSIFSVQVSNAGEGRISPSYLLEVYDAQGNQIRRIPLPKKGLYPGSLALLEFELDNLDAGKYTFMVLADDGVQDVSGVKYTIHWKE
ncbi:hypothetical protein [Deinococcus misasensis]|uniref:hypothetical protein n=1 Tax=Deinococcus misasensis TaxID=392413 RepID=UPI000550255B|nr:hypothetical protein [Deinococcus misasensis]